MALKTLSQQLEEVQTAISAVMSGQAYEIAGRKMTKANLSELSDREDSLIDKINKFGANFIVGTSKTQKAGLNVQFS